MKKIKIRITNIIYWLALISADIFILLILGLLLMGYDDNYDSLKGEYWSLASMNTTEKILYFSYNLWIILNIIAIIYLGKKVYKWFKEN